MQKNDLALNSYLDLDDDSARNKTSWKMLLGFVLITVAYILRPQILGIWRTKNVVLQNVLVIILLLILASLALYFSHTTHVLQRRLKFNKAQLIWSGILLVVLLPYLVITVMNALHQSFSKIFAVFMMAIMAAVIEELSFRCLLFNGLLSIFYKKKYSLLIASLVSSLMFGLLHLINVTHQPLQSTIGQVLFALTLGLISMYLRLCSNGMICCIVFHFLVDFKPEVLSTNTGTHDAPMGMLLMVFLPVIILTTICIWLFNRQYLKLKH